MRFEVKGAAAAAWPKRSTTSSVSDAFIPPEGST